MVNKPPTKHLYIKKIQQILFLWKAKQTSLKTWRVHKNLLSKCTTRSWKKWLSSSWTRHKMQEKWGLMTHFNYNRTKKPVYFLGYQFTVALSLMILNSFQPCQRSPPKNYSFTNPFNDYLSYYLQFHQKDFLFI